MTGLEAALGYARRGWRVFPLHGIAGDGCTCRLRGACTNAGKHPWGDGWQTHATTDPARIRRWFARYPNMNLGVAMGAASGVFALDVDVAKGGDDTLCNLECVFGALPETVTVLTGAGGRNRHMFFQHPGTPVPNSVGTLGPGLDVRGDGGYVVGVGSRHRSGRTYVYEVTADPDTVCRAVAPPWLLDRLQTRTADRLRADATPMVLREGERNQRLFQLGSALRRYGLDETAIRGCLEVANRQHATPPLEGDEVARIAASAARYTPVPPPAMAPAAAADPATVEASDEPAAPTSPGPEPWSRAMTAASFVAELEADLDWLEPRLLAPGSITEWFSPRGLGKTQVALALAVQLARRGHPVLLLDRDNSRREVRRRLRAWGAADLTAFRVMTRDDVPPLTDRAAWKAFPFEDYKLVIVDSFDASTEGIGEQDSAKPSTALAPLLDIAHRAAGPGILVLGNTIKSGAHGRSCGVTEDRADIVYEVRDATDLHPTGTKPWWLELPSAGREAWGEWASRRHRRDVYRLAFIASKCRIGEEPDPFVLEVNLRGEVWTLREVTAEIEEAGRASVADAAQRRVEAETGALDRLEEQVTRRHGTGEAPLNLTAAVEVLHDAGVPRDIARSLIDREGGRRWQLVPDTAHRGHPLRVVGVNQEWPPEKELPFEKPRQSRNSDECSSPAAVPHGPEKKTTPETIEPCGLQGMPSFSGNGPRNTPSGPPDGAPEGDDVEVF